MNRICLSLLLASVLVTSCFQDLGNYDYKEVEDFEVTGLQASYDVYTSENLVIEPVVIPQSGDYEYEWFLTEYRSGGYQIEQYANVLSNERILDVPFKRSTGEYELYLKVTSKTSGDAKFVRMTINAITPYTNACYILYEMKDGNSEVDIHYPQAAPTFKAVEKFTGESLQGRPKYLSYLPSFAYLDENTGTKVFNTLIVPASEQSMVSFNTTDMSIARQPRQWFYEDYDVLKIKNISSFACAVVVFAETGVHTTQQLTPGTPMTGKFSAVPDVMGGLTSCDVSSNICYFGNYLFFYDNINRRLMCMNHNCQSSVRDVLSPSPITGEEPTPVEIEGDVIFIGGMAPQGVIDYKFMDYMIIITECDNGQRNWYYVKMDKGEDATLNAVNLVKKGTFEDGSAFADATFYTSCKNGANYVYAVSGNRFYAMNPNDGIETEITFVNQPEGEVTYFQTMFEVAKGAPAETDYNCFAFATCSQGKYTVVFYDMIGGMPKIQEPSRKYEGEGKVKSIQVASQTRGAGLMGYHSNTLFSIHY